MNNKDRILQISHDLGLTHIGSNLSCLPLLEEIYSKRKPGDKIILSNGHSHLAHLIIRDEVIDDGLQSNLVIEDVIRDYGIHCDRLAGCDASAGSLGHGIGIGIGYALANPQTTVYVIVSDGSLQEGSEAEALRIAKTLNITNLKIYANLNGYTATAKIDLDYLESWVKGFGFPVKFFRTNNGLPELEGLKGHYEILK